MAIEISDYYVCQISVAECWEHKLVVWGLVHKMYNYSRHHNRNCFNSSMYSFINVIDLQVVSDENSTTILATFQLSWALRGLWVCVYWRHRQ